MAVWWYTVSQRLSIVANESTDIALLKECFKIDITVSFIKQFSGIGSSSPHQLFNPSGVVVDIGGHIVHLSANCHPTIVRLIVLLQLVQCHIDAWPCDSGEIVIAWSVLHPADQREARFQSYFVASWSSSIAAQSEERRCWLFHSQDVKLIRWFFLFTHDLFPWPQ